MTFAAEFRFVLGRYHATPWDRHVNDGESEWPPSPWRLCRALYAVWKDRCPGIPTATALGLLAKVAEPPTYALPQWSVAATRHYYPDSAHKPVVDVSVDKVIDSFVAVARDSTMRIEWPGELDPAQVDAFSELLTQLSYIGRAESIVEARIVDTSPPSNIGDATGSAHEQADGSRGSTTQPDRALISMAPNDFGDTSVMVPRLPLVETDLTIGTVAMRSGRQLFPPGATLVTYSAPSQPDRRSTSRPKVRSTAGLPTTAVVAVAGRPAPHIHDALFAAERVRRAWNSIGARDPALSGHRPDGSPLQDGHRHVHLLPIAGTDKRIRAFVAWAPGGLSPEAIHSIAAVREISSVRHTRSTSPTTGSGDDDAVPARSSKQVASPFWLTLVSVGGHDGSVGSSLAMPDELAGPATVWSSATPFVPSRHQHPKRYSGERTGMYLHDFIDEEVNRELAARNLPSADVHVLPRSLGASQLFTRHRNKDGLRGARPGMMLGLVFAQPLSGPISIGQHNHFGLGLFVPDDERLKWKE